MATSNEKKFIIKSNSNLDSRLKLWDVRSDFSDVILICGKDEEKIPAHKIILAASSIFFREILPTTNEVKLPEISRTELEHILEFIYSGQTTILERDLKCFTHNAEKLKIKGLPKDVPRLMPEILVKIFGHLTTQDLLKNVALVSKQFNSLTNDFQVPLGFEINTQTPLHVVQGILTRSHQIRQIFLDFKVLSPESTGCRLMVSSIKLLKNLEILDTQDENSHYLNDLFKVFPLRKLKMHNSDNIEHIGECRTLEHVNLKYYLASLDEFKMFSSLVHLKSLEVYLSEEIQAEDVKRVFSKLTHMHRLRLGFLTLNINLFKAVTESCPLLKKLKILTIHLEDSMTDEQLNMNLERHKHLETVIFKPYLNKVPYRKFQPESFPNFTITEVPTTRYLSTGHIVHVTRRKKEEI